MCFQVKKTRCLILELLRKAIGPITTELWIEMLCSLINIKKIEIFWILVWKKADWIQSELFLDFKSTIGPKLALLLLFVH